LRGTWAWSPGAQGLGQHGLDLGEHVVSGATELGICPAGDDPGAQDQRLELGRREHERRQVVAVAQQVAGAGGAVDRHARADQVSDVAIDGPARDLELVGQRARRDQLAAPQDLDDLEKPVGATHVALPRPAGR
jgi:hypothetical protein